MSESEKQVLQGEIDPRAFQEAFKAARSYPGMGSLTVQWNPYECHWEADINFSDNSRYIGTNESVTVALQEATRKVHEARRTNRPDN